MSMIASGAPGYTTRPAPSCVHLAGRCTETDPHDMHWGVGNKIPMLQATHDVQALAVAQLFSCEDETGHEFEPVLSVSFAGFDGELRLHEVDQHIAGVRAYLARLEQQAVELEAARRQWEATR